jgi:hypothetical protein
MLKMLPADVANDAAVRGIRGAPNRWRIPEELHIAIHHGPGGGAYNQRWKEELAKLQRPPTVDDIVGIRERLVKEFGLDQYHP